MTAVYGTGEDSEQLQAVDSREPVKLVYFMGVLLGEQPKNSPRSPVEWAG